MEFSQVATVVSIVVITYLIGYTCKCLGFVNDKFIPSIVGISGAILGVVGLYVIQDFYVGGYDNGSWDTSASKETGIVFWGERSVADAEEASMLATSLNMAFGKFTLKIGESGSSSISKK